MNNDLTNIQYSPIWDHSYAQWFQEVHYNEKTLSEAERKEFVSVIDETIEEYSEGLQLMYDSLEDSRLQHDEYHEIEHTIISILLFVLITMIDSMVASKYFILADKDYDRRFMRGKLKVLLNEGFKKLYGFDKQTYKKSEWDRLLPLMKYFPEVINLQYQELTFHLDNHAQSSSWWKEERDLETHYFDAKKLLEARREDISESRVMMDTMKLFRTLLAVNQYLSNLHTCLYNYLVTKYKQGELSSGKL